MSITAGEFIELKYTGTIEGKVFDSNHPEHFKEADRDKLRKLIVIVGQGFVVPGLDKALVGKELNQSYTIHVMPQEAFGVREAGLVKTFPLKVFQEQNIQPMPGMTLMLDNSPVLVRSVSGARVTIDFNNPLAGKEIDYTFEIFRKVTDLKEKAHAFFHGFFRLDPVLEVSDKVTLVGPKALEPFITIAKDKFKELVGAELTFRVEEKKPESSSKDLSTQQSL